MSTYPHNLTQPPSASKTKEYFRWADYVELLCLSSRDSEFSANDLLPYLYQDADLIVEDDEERRPDRKRERWEGRIHDFYSILEHRQQFLGRFYPFSITQGHLLTVNDTFSNEQYFYLYLLFSSNLAYFKAQQPLFTSFFEAVAQKTLQCLLPIGSEVHVFGTARSGSRYTGNLFERICQLGTDIRAIPTCSQCNFEGMSGGDGGLDIVAWTPIPDQAAGIPVFFSQCACTVDQWREKQGSVGTGRWGNRYRWITPYNPVVLVPFSFRKADGLWENDDHIENTLMIDRDRIIKVLNNNIDFFPTTAAYGTVQSLAQTKVSRA